MGIQRRHRNLFFEDIQAAHGCRGRSFRALCHPNLLVEQDRRSRGEYRSSTNTTVAPVSERRVRGFDKGEWTNQQLLFLVLGRTGGVCPSGFRTAARGVRNTPSV